MPKLLALSLSFTFGLMLLPAILPGMRMRGMAGALKVGLLGGLLSAMIGKILIVLLSLLIFLPIRVNGPVGAFLVQGLVNTILLLIVSKAASSLEFDRFRTALWAAFALTALQTVVRMVV